MNSFFWCKNKSNDYADIYVILGIFFRYINYKSIIRDPQFIYIIMNGEINCRNKVIIKYLI